MTEKNYPDWFETFFDRIEALEQDVFYLKKMLHDVKGGKKEPILEVKLNEWTYDLCSKDYAIKMLMYMKPEKDFEIIRHIFFHPQLHPDQYSIRLNMIHKQLEFWGEGGEWVRCEENHNTFLSITRNLQKFYLKAIKDEKLSIENPNIYFELSNYVFGIHLQMNSSKIYKIILHHLQKQC